MSRALVILNSKYDREKAIQWAAKAPTGTRVEFKAAKRTLPMNAKFWACLTDIAIQVKWHGERLTPDEWRLIFLDALKREMRLVPNIDGTGFVNIGRSSSDLSKEEFSGLLELVLMFGANHGVIFHDTNSAGTLPPQSDKPAAAWERAVAGNNLEPAQ